MVRDFVLEEAGTGVEACVMLGTYRPDLLLLDLFMPEMDGLEVVRTIKKNPELSGIKVVLLTGYPDDVRVRQAVELGVLGVLGKPFDLEELVAMVLRIVGR
jgi:CheY-like chemotaxis protein